MKLPIFLITANAAAELELDPAKDIIFGKYKNMKTCELMELDRF